MAAAVMVASGALAVAAPAGAATTTVPVTCLNVSGQVNPVSVTLAPGDVLQFDKNGCYFFGVRAYGAQSASTPVTVGTVEYQATGGGEWTVTTTSWVGDPNPVAVRYTAPSNGTTSDAFYVYAACQGCGLAGYLVTVTISGGPAPATPSIPIPPWVQAYGIFHHDDACLTGWTNSWQHWAEPITGGWVCTRTIPSLG